MRPDRHFGRPILRCINAALLLSLLSAARPAFCQTAPELTPATGEIRVEGYVRSVDPGSLVLVITAYAGISNQTIVLAAARAKTITVPATASIHTRGAASRKLAFSDITAGTVLGVVGKDTGPGLPLIAREIAVGAPAAVPVVTATPAVTATPTIIPPGGPDPASETEPGSDNAPQLVLQIPHSSSVQAVAMAPDGKTFATGGGDRAVKVWDSATRALLAALPGNGAGVFALAYSKDGSRLASGGDDGLVHLYDAHTFRLLPLSFRYGGRTLGIAFSPDGHTIAVGGRGSKLLMFDVQTGKLRGAIETAAHDVMSVAWSSDGSLIATGGGNSDDSPAVGVVEIWDGRTGALRGSLAGHTGNVWAVAFSPNGSLLASGSSDKTIRLWNTATGQTLNTLTGHNNGVCCLAFSNDGKTLVSGARLSLGGGAGEVRLWDSETGALKQTIPAHGGIVSGVAFTPGDKSVISVSQDRTIKIWDSATGQNQATIDGAEMPTVLAASLSADGNWIATGGSDNVIRMWSRTAGKFQGPIKGHTGAVTGLSFSPNSSVLATGSADGTFRLWTVATGTLLRCSSPLAHGGVTCLCYSKDGTLIAAGGEDHEIKEYSGASGEWLRRIGGYPDDITAVAFSADCKQLAVATKSGIVSVSDAVTGTFIRGTVKCPSVESVVYSPDGKTIDTAGMEQLVRVYDTDDAELLSKLTPAHGYGHTILSFSPDGKTLALGLATGDIALCDPDTGELRLTLSGHTGEVVSISFSPDNNTLLSGSLDGTARLWDVKAGKLLVTMLSIPSPDPELADAWIAYTPEGYYNANTAAKRYIKWRVGDQIHPAADYEKEYKQADRVAKIMQR